MIDPTEDDFTILYIHSDKPYQQRMFSCLPAKFVPDPHPPKYRDFRETDLSKPPTIVLEDCMVLDLTATSQ
jgi:hypothetical protein